MTVTIYTPAQCTERETGGAEDCTWCSGVMLQNLAHSANVAPSTRSEYEALRVAGGDGPAENPGDGSNIGQLAIGMLRRYGWQPRRVGPPGFPKASWATVLNGLGTVGDGAAIQGSMGVFPRTGHWRRWDPAFGGGHAMFVERVDLHDRVWLQNPLAPATYPGEFMPMSDLKAFYDGLNGGVAFAHLGQQAPKAPAVVHIAHGAPVKVYDLDPVTGRIKTQPDGSYGRVFHWEGPNSHAAIYQPPGEVRRRTVDGKSSGMTVRVKPGADRRIAGRWIQTDVPGVSVS